MSDKQLVRDLDKPEEEKTEEPAQLGACSLTGASTSKQSTDPGQQIISKMDMRAIAHGSRKYGERIRGIIEEVTDIKCTQTTISKDLDKMRVENNILYRDMSFVIEKTDQQQNILEKLLNFLRTIVGHNKPNLKRNFPFATEGPPIHKAISFHQEDASTSAAASANSQELAAIVPALISAAIPLPVCISPIAKSSSVTFEPTEDEEGSLLIKKDFQCRANAVQVDLEVLQKLLGPTGLDLPFDMVTRLFDEAQTHVPVPSNYMMKKEEWNGRGVSDSEMADADSSKADIDLTEDSGYPHEDLDSTNRVLPQQP